MTPASSLQPHDTPKPALKRSASSVGCERRRTVAVVNQVFSVFFWTLLVVTSLVLFPIAILVWLVTAPFDPRRKLLHLFTCFWASLYTWLNPLWRVTVRGRELFRSDQTYVMVANHLSLLDILVLFRLRKHFTWVSKLENFKVPVIGWNMRLNHYVELRRGDRASVQQMLATCERELRGGTSVMIFPEGTRSRSGALQPFKAGAFDLALTTGLPILPVVFEGTSLALPKRGFVLRGRHRITMTVLEPIHPTTFADLDAEQLAQRTRALFVERLAV